jgi:hypothetical protein
VKRLAAALLAIAFLVSSAAGAAPAEEAPLPPIDLTTILLQSLPPGFTQLPDQPGRLGPLDAGAAAAVLDQSGRVKADMLVKAGFRAGHSRAWAKQDSQDVVVDVLLSFGTDREARIFARGFLSGRRQTTKQFEVAGVPEASGFERGPTTPSRTTPGQREVIMQRGRVLAIVVLAGFASYPNVEVARTLAETQRTTLATVAPTADSDTSDEEQKRTALTGVALLLLVVAAWRMVDTVSRHPLTVWSA